VVRAEGLEPSRGYPQRIFIPATAFAARTGGASGAVCGLDYPFTIARAGALFALGAARLVSTPSREHSAMLQGLARDCHVTGFPEFEQFCIPGFPRAHSIFQVRCVYHSATPAAARLLRISS
jgi:hypothetical protein